MSATLATLALLAAASADPPAARLPVIDGWTLAPVEVYGPQDLFEYINGAADAFLHQDFVELVAAEYLGPKAAVVTVDLYRHRDARRAWGIYSQERSPHGTPLALGVEGSIADDHLEVVVGAVYLKLTGRGGAGRQAMQTVAERVVGALPGTRESPAVIAAFPAAGKVARSEVLLARNVLGHGFLRDGAVAAYEIGGARFRVFAIDGGDAAAARAMLTAYLSLGGVTRAPGPTGSVVLTDPLNGEVELHWRGRWLWGAVDAPAAVRAALVKELGARLAAVPP